MTSERDREEFTVVQRFNNPRIVESDVSSLNAPIALGEFVDNFLDERIPGKRTNIVITFDRGGKRISFDCSGTNGMGREKIEQYPIWGESYDDPNKIKEHGQGGKLAALYFLDKNKGGVRVYSQPPGARESCEMEIENWWSNLREGRSFNAAVLRNDVQTLPEGFTRFELNSVRLDRFPNSMNQLADNLGLTYGKLIEEGVLSIKLRRLNGKSMQNLDVLAVTVPFSDSFVREQEKVPTGDRQRGPKIDVKWGLIDQDEKMNSARERENNYKRNLGVGEKADPIHGDSIYYYYHGRLLEAVSLQRMKIPGYTRRNIMDSFAVTVDVTEGWAPKTVLKTGLSLSSTELIDINSKVTSLIQGDVASLVKGSEDSVLEKNRSKTKEVTQDLAAVLNKMFDNNPVQIAETFSLPMSGNIYGKDRSSNNTVRSSEPLPGTRASRRETTGEVLPTRKSSERTGWRNPIPDVTIANFTNPEAEAELGVDVFGKNVIELNNKNPYVRFILRQKGEVFRGMSLRVCAQVLFEERWKRVYLNNAEKFREMVDRDVEQFMSTAEKLKKI